MTATRLKPATKPSPCPVCDWKRTDAEAIKTHNTQASLTGCRRYPK